MPYQKTGPTNFDELWIIDSSNNEGTNSRVTGKKQERMVHRTWAHEGRHKTCNGWYLEMVAPIPSNLSYWFYIVRHSGSVTN